MTVPDVKTDAKPAPSAAALRLVSEIPAGAPDVSLSDFYSVMPLRQYYCTKTGDFCSAPAVSGRFGNTTLPGGVSAAQWLDANRAVEQLTWAPGDPTLIRDRVLRNSVWVPQPGYTCLNSYEPPPELDGDKDEAGPWLDHVSYIYPTDRSHIIRWFAQRVQHPGVKVNHALVFIGAPGIGKDTLIQPVKHGVGTWNCEDIGPQQILQRFNGYAKSVLLTISEIRDLGEGDRYHFHERMKTLLAAPPDVIRVDEKNLKEYNVLNAVGVIITSNYLANGMFLDATDRRHYVAYSEKTRQQISAEKGDTYFASLYQWYEDGGYGHVAAYLRSVDLTTFDPKAAPPQTEAFWTIVASNKGPEDAELADAVEQLANPQALTLLDIAGEADEAFRVELLDRKNASRISHRLADAGYVPAMNPDRPKDGLWKVGGKRQRIYARQELSVLERIIAAKGRAGGR